MEFAFVIQKMPWIGVFWHAFTEKENEFLSLLCLLWNEQTVHMSYAFSL